MITAICQECNNQFEYELKPGFPRKYCSTCSEIKKQEYANRQTLEVPVVKPGVPMQVGATIEEQMVRKAWNPKPNTPLIVKKPNAYPKDPVGLAVEIYENVSGPDPQSRMALAIKVVKQAQAAFS